METIQLAGMTLLTLASGAGYALIVRRRLVNEQRERSNASDAQIRALEAEVASLGGIAERLAEDLARSNADFGSQESDALDGLQRELAQLTRTAEENRMEAGERSERLADQLAQLTRSIETAPLETQSYSDELEEITRQLEVAQENQAVERERAVESELTVRAAHAAEIAQLQSEKQALAARWDEALTRLEELEALRLPSGRLDSEPQARVAEPMGALLPFPEPDLDSGSDSDSHSDSESSASADDLTTQDLWESAQLEGHSAEELRGSGPAGQILDLIVDLEQCAVGSEQRRNLVRDLDELLAGMKTRLCVDD